MDRQSAETLIGELAKHEATAYDRISVDRGMFINLLASTDIHNSSEFYHALPNSPQVVQEMGRYYHLSLRGVLENRNSQNHQLSCLGNALEATASFFRIYHSDALVRDLRTNRDLMKMIMECEYPYSLVGEFQTWDYYNPEETLFIKTEPLLIILQVTDQEKIREWERTNITREKEVGFFFRHRRKIKPEEYDLSLDF